MTKREIVKTISDRTGLTQRQIKQVVQLTFASIVDSLVEDGRVELRNFGIFQVKSRAARAARNPKTGVQVMVPERFVVSFKAGKVMEQRVADLTEMPDLPSTSDEDDLLLDDEPMPDSYPSE